MTDKPDDQAEMVLSIEAFGRMVTLMAGQVSGAGSGPAQAANIEAAAAPQTAALAQWIEALYGDNADAFAKELGRLDAVSLRAFVEGGKLPGECAHCIASGVDLEARAGRGETPLHMAATHGKLVLD